MKTVISNNNGFKYLVEVKEIEYPKGNTHLKFTTEWDGARRDGSEQKKFEIFLTEQQRANLKDIL
jgi:hypothetical protein